MKNLIFKIEPTREKYLSYYSLWKAKKFLGIFYWKNLLISGDLDDLKKIVKHQSAPVIYYKNGQIIES